MDHLLFVSFVIEIKAKKKKTKMKRKSELKALRGEVVIVMLERETVLNKPRRRSSYVLYSQLYTTFIIPHTRRTKSLSTFFRSFRYSFIPIEMKMKLPRTGKATNRMRLGPTLCRLCYMFV